MTQISFKLLACLPLSGAMCLLALSCAPETPPTEADTPEPIAYIGHGGFFDQQGRQIVPTAEFVASAQDWYRRKLVAGLDPARREQFADFEKRLNSAVKTTGQARLVVQQRQLDWLIAYSPKARQDGRTLGKINALKYQLKWELPERQPLGEFATGRRFRPDPQLDRALARPDLNAPPGPQFLATTNTKAAYTAECTAADVPIPPPINQMAPTIPGWKSEGFIPTNKQFIVGTPAELRSFENDKGMCFALPRYTDSNKTDVALDGVICLSQISSKVCVWDNQMGGVGFEFPKDTKIPIGDVDLSVNAAGLYQAGGFELNNGTGGVCTDCHAGENPYVIHPKADLGGGVLMGDLPLPTFSPNRYIPLIPASWPQNDASQASAFVPPVCQGCHVKAGAGRFPHLSAVYNTPNPPLDDGGYCQTILAQALVKTMPPPPQTPGSEANTAAVAAFKALCEDPPDSSTADYGDPHLTTTNGVRYDFQAAGEFTSLRNSDTGFELQTRQSPVLTSFTPGANAYTGLSSCVSLNTAAAVRVGSHRISYQLSPNRPASAEQMQLRIDGKLVTLPANRVDLGDGSTIARAASGGGLDIKLGDGTRLLISPHYWASEGYWYLNIDVLNTRAREGTMGHIPKSNWLPLGPGGTSFGPAPASLAERHVLLNQKFADAWRVTSATSLFDYPPGLSTESFTDRNWPPPSGEPCRASATTPWGPGPARQPVQPIGREAAVQACGIVKDKAQFENCVFDVTVTGERGMAQAYANALRLRRAALPSTGPGGPADSEGAPGGGAAAGIFGLSWNWVVALALLLLALIVLLWLLVLRRRSGP